jgi:hypothetical protein
MKGTSTVPAFSVVAALLSVALSALPARAQADAERLVQELTELRRTVQQLSLELKSASAQWEKGLRELKALGETVAALKDEQKELALTIRTSELDHREITLRLRELDQIRRDLEGRGGRSARPRPEESEPAPESRRPRREEEPARPRTEAPKEPKPGAEAPKAPPEPEKLVPVTAEQRALLEDAQKLFYNEQDYAKARELLDRLLGESGLARVVKAQALHTRGLCHHRLKDYQKAIADFREALTVTGPSETRGSLLYNIACGLALQGEKDAALESLKKAFAEKFDDPGFRHTKADPDLESLRADPRFKELVAGK